MKSVSHNLAVIGGILMALALGTGGCSPNVDRLVVVDKNGKQTVLKGGLNAGVTNLSGDFRATVTVRFPDGNPAANLPYQLECPLALSNSVVAAGTLSPGGGAMIDGLAAADPPVVYHLEVDGQLLGAVPLGLDRNANQFEFLLPAKTGMKAPTLALRDLNSSENFQLADLRGQVVFLEFYTTDCAPCQPVLSKLNELLGRRADAWRGKVTILAVGLDAVLQPGRAVDIVAKHLSRKGWKRLRPVVPDQDFSWEPTRRFPFGVSGVPHSFLIDRDGIILWSGHPGGLELEGRIEELLKQDAEPDGPAHGSQPIRSETNRTSSAAGSRR